MHKSRRARWGFDVLARSCGWRRPMVRWSHWWWCCRNRSMTATHKTLYTTTTTTTKRKEKKEEKDVCVCMHVTWSIIGFSFIIIIPFLICTEQPNTRLKRREEKRRIEVQLTLTERLMQLAVDYDELHDETIHIWIEKKRTTTTVIAASRTHLQTLLWHLTVLFFFLFFFVKLRWSWHWTFSSSPLQT